MILLVPLDRVRLCELRAVSQELFGDGGNVVAAVDGKAEVDMRGGQFVDVELRKESASQPAVDETEGERRTLGVERA